MACALFHDKMDRASREVGDRCGSNCRDHKRAAGWHHLSARLHHAGTMTAVQQAGPLWSMLCALRRCCALDVCFLP